MALIAYRIAGNFRLVLGELLAFKSDLLFSLPEQPTPCRVRYPGYILPYGRLSGRTLTV